MRMAWLGAAKGDVVTAEVLKRDESGKPVVVVYTESLAEREARQGMWADQQLQAQEVARSLWG